VPQAFLNQLQDLKDTVMFTTKTQHKPCPKCNLDHPLGQYTWSDNQKARNDHISTLLHRMSESEDKKQRLQLGHDMVVEAIKGTQKTYKSKSKRFPRTKHDKDNQEKTGTAAREGKVGDREGASPEVLKICRDQKLYISFEKTDRCERAACTWEHRRLEDKKVSFKGVGVNMMNFLTNVTNEDMHENGAGPVVEVPVGTVMRFPFASHFPDFLIGEEIREIIGIEIRSGTEIHDFDIEQELVIELEELEEWSHRSGSTSLGRWSWVRALWITLSHHTWKTMSHHRQKWKHNCNGFVICTNRSSKWKHIYSGPVTNKNSMRSTRSLRTKRAKTRS
jgi:hypothetical protein